MATKYGKNYHRQFVAVPSEKIPVGEHNGRVRMAYDEFDLADADEGGGVAVANGDVLLFMKLPAGARVVDALIDSPDLGGTSLVELGWQANGVDAADADGFITSLDVSGQAAVKRADNAAGLLKSFSVETQVMATITNAGASTSGVIQVAVFYVVD